jgi:hypothetical protein
VVFWCCLRHGGKFALKGDVDNAFVQGRRGSWFVKGAREVEETLSLAFLGENLIDGSQFALRVVKCCFVEHDECY